MNKQEVIEKAHKIVFALPLPTSAEVRKALEDLSDSIRNAALEDAAKITDGLKDNTLSFLIRKLKEE
jgi:hypothetical protein